MSPNDNNPFAPSGTGSAGTSGTGASGSSPIPSPLDFTNPDALNSTSSLSMSDSLASAQDDLTSAGQAAANSSDAIGLDQLDLNSNSITTSSASYDDRPLVPAAPVPGSIGSAMSAPAASDTTATNASDTSSSRNPFGGSTSTGAVMGTTNTTPTPVTSSNMPNLGGANTASATVPSTPSNPTSASATSASSYYNPFSRNNTAAPSNTSATSVATPSFGMNSTSTTPTSTSAPAGMSSSSTVPPSLQPQTEKFSQGKAAGKGFGGGINILTIVSWVLTLIMLGLSIFFFISWQDAEERASKPQIIYKDPEVTKKLTTMSCTQEVAEPVQEGVENLISMKRVATADFVDQKMNKMSLITSYGFPDPEAYEASRPFFDGLAAAYAEEAIASGATALETNITSDEGNILNFGLIAKPDQIKGSNIGKLMLNTNENGEALTDLNDVRAAYQGAGFICVETDGPVNE